MLGCKPNNLPPAASGKIGSISFNGIARLDLVVAYSLYSDVDLGMSLLKESLPPDINTHTNALYSGSPAVVLLAKAAAENAFRLTREEYSVETPMAAQLAWPKNFLLLIGLSLNLIFIYRRNRIERNKLSGLFHDGIIWRNHDQVHSKPCPVIPVIF